MNTRVDAARRDGAISVLGGLTGVAPHGEWIDL